MSDLPELWGQVKSPEVCVTFTLPGYYNPDLFDDLQGRLIATFDKAMNVVRYYQAEDLDDELAELATEDGDVERVADGDNG